MEERSKTTMEIFKELYPVDELMDNPLKAVEAIGWLKCTKQYVPSLAGDIEHNIIILSMIIALKAIEKEN